MIDESTAVLPLWMLISATFGFMIGEATWIFLPPPEVP